MCRTAPLLRSVGGIPTTTESERHTEAAQWHPEDVGVVEMVKENEVKHTVAIYRIQLRDVLYLYPLCYM